MGYHQTCLGIYGLSIFCSTMHNSGFELCVGFWQPWTWISLLEPAPVWMVCTPRTLKTPEPMMVVTTTMTPKSMNVGATPMPEVCPASDSFSASPQHLGPLLLRPAVSEPRLKPVTTINQSNSDEWNESIRKPTTEHILLEVIQWVCSFLRTD